MAVDEVAALGQAEPQMGTDRRSVLSRGAVVRTVHDVDDVRIAGV